MLPIDDFKAVVSNAPLFAIDLVVVNSAQQLLVGLRKNAPAKGFWFVPGGRVYKNETQQQAFARISKQELGVALNIDNALLLGVHDHFYTDSIFGCNISTHYINTPYLLRINEQDLVLPTEQHSEYKWVALSTLTQDASVHQFSKVFLPGLIQAGYRQSESANAK
ncbi:GDP-mannose mannosyl hydrolase [Rheinheimera sp. YQF-2]|uniref:GDP-mannose mannosyl hydrolase n=1 Tax=Rheinheimera lutimaris TaxID=2740584 RepID=A0A7Y5APR2_9GAMM|nr:GDP-mannose mannosyl hydrolase [Rheinheimera lutimaris]NRQ42232.1 GDP-mannose mannosyl hydrolase [Rheinheimera lutimaris]